VKLEIRLFDKHHVRSTWLVLFAPQLPTSERNQGFSLLQNRFTLPSSLFASLGLPQRADCLPAVSQGCLLEMEGGRRLWEP